MILCSGAFDGLHSGHVVYLQEAKALAPDEPLWVAVAPDAYITHEKHRVPRWTQAQRATTVGALACVDCVVEQYDPSVAETIRQWKPTMFVKGQDWLDRIPQDVAAACVEAGTALAFVETEQTHCTEGFWQELGRSL